MGQQPKPPVFNGQHVWPTMQENCLSGHWNVSPSSADADEKLRAKSKMNANNRAEERTNKDIFGAVERQE